MSEKGKTMKQVSKSIADLAAGEWTTMETFRGGPHVNVACEDEGYYSAAAMTANGVLMSKLELNGTTASIVVAVVDAWTAELRDRGQL